MLVIYMQAVADQLPRLGKRESKFVCNYVVSVRKGFLFLWVLGMGCIILLWPSLSLPYNYFKSVIIPLATSVDKNNKTVRRKRAGAN